MVHPLVYFIFFLFNKYFKVFKYYCLSFYISVLIVICPENLYDKEQMFHKCLHTCILTLSNWKHFNYDLFSSCKTRYLLACFLPMYSFVFLLNMSEGPNHVKGVWVYVYVYINVCMLAFITLSNWTKKYLYR